MITCLYKNRNWIIVKNHYHVLNWLQNINIRFIRWNHWSNFIEYLEVSQIYWRHYYLLIHILLYRSFSFSPGANRDEFSLFHIRTGATLHNMFRDQIIEEWIKINGTMFLNFIKISKTKTSSPCTIRMEVNTVVFETVCIWNQNSLPTCTLPFYNIILFQLGQSWSTSLSNL